MVERIAIIYIKSEEANEDLLFREEVMRQFEYFYQYMHGDRKEPVLVQKH